MTTSRTLTDQTQAKWYDKTWVESFIKVAIIIAIGGAITLPDSSQPGALILLLISIPICFSKYKLLDGQDKVWLAMLNIPLLVSIYLCYTSGTGEALAPGARYFGTSLILIALNGYCFGWKLIFRAASIGAIITVLYRYDNIFLDRRIDWGTGYIHSAFIAVSLMVMCITQLCLEKKIIWRLIALAGAVFCMVIIIKSGTRGAWIALAGVLIVQLFMIPTNFKRRAASFSIIAVMFVIAIFSFPELEERVDEAVSDWHQYMDDSQKFSSIGVRLDLWKISIRAFKESPVIGVSFPRRSEMMQEYIDQNPGSEPMGTDGRSSAHNEIFNMMATRGILGLLALLGLYLLPLMYFYRYTKVSNDRQVRYVALAGVGVVVSMMLCGLSEAPLMNVRVSTFYGITIVCLYHILKNLERTSCRSQLDGTSE